jgi:predicted ATP-grasp superfamily ATP-dependent carboligase
MHKIKSKMNEFQRNVLAKIADMMMVDEDEVLDPNDCGEPNCIGCDVRHGISAMIMSDPKRALEIVEKANVEMDAIKVVMDQLNKERDELMARKDQVEERLEKAYSAILKDVQEHKPNNVVFLH